MEMEENPESPPRDIIFETYNCRKDIEPEPVQNFPPPERLKQTKNTVGGWKEIQRRLKYRKNSDIVNEKRREWYKKNRETLNEKRRERRRRNKDHVNLTVRKWYQQRQELKHKKENGGQENDNSDTPQRRFPILQLTPIVKSSTRKSKKIN